MMAPNENVQTHTTRELSTIDSVGMKITEIGRRALDRFLPPERREEAFAKIQAFVFANPKLSVCISSKTRPDKGADKKHRRPF